MPRVLTRGMFALLTQTSARGFALVGSSRSASTKSPSLSPRGATAQIFSLRCQSPQYITSLLVKRAGVTSFSTSSRLRSEPPVIESGAPAGTAKAGKESPSSHLVFSLNLRHIYRGTGKRLTSISLSLSIAYPERLIIYHAGTGSEFSQSNPKSVDERNRP